MELHGYIFKTCLAINLTNKICIHIPDNYFSNKCKTNSTIIITCMSYNCMLLLVDLNQMDFNE